MIPTVFLNNQFLPKNEAKISPFDHGFLYGDAVYETLLIADYKIDNFEAHYLRLQKSCGVLGIMFPEYFSERGKIQDIISLLIEKNRNFLLSSNGKGRLRITLSRGENNFDFSSCNKATVLISLSSLSFSGNSEKILAGVSLKTIELERSYPEVKSTNFLASLLGRREISETGEYEGVFVTPEGFLREGTVSNIIAISSEKKIFWLAPEKTVLAGTMQEKISEILLNFGYKKEERDFTFSDIQKNFLDICIANSLFGIIPVREIDNTLLSSYQKNNHKFLAYEKISLALNTKNP